MVLVCRYGRRLQPLLGILVQACQLSRVGRPWPGQAKGPALVPGPKAEHLGTMSTTPPRTPDRWPSPEQVEQDAPREDGSHGLPGYGQPPEPKPDPRDEKKKG